MAINIGPWAISKVGNAYDDWMLFDSDGVCISATIHGEGNADLIVAAPELLEVLEELSEARKKQDHDFDIDAWFKKAREIIADAKGEFR